MCHTRMIAGFLMALALASGPADAGQGPQSGLKIVVIEGEDAVNIIQQKTAVAPIVEVRDRNDLPVPGAVVTFAVQGGRAASFAGGVPTLTVTTNAAGQAVAAGFSPLSSGAVTINVQAAFQGQTIAATIAQTNVLTAAEAAAAASGASSAGGGASGAGGAAGGGGMSGAMIGVVGVAAAAGTVAAVAATREEGAPTGPITYTGPFSGQFISTMTSPGAPTCTITRAISGTMTMTLETRPDGSVSGPSQIVGTDLVVARTCAGEQVNVPFSGRETVTGTAASLGFTRESTNSGTAAEGGTFTTTTMVAFTGSLSNGVITGTLSYKEQGTFQNRTFPGQSSGSTSMPVTLRQ